jgi:hypothetical protein
VLVAVLGYKKFVSGLKGKNRLRFV